MFMQNTLYELSLAEAGFKPQTEPDAPQPRVSTPLARSQSLLSEVTVALKELMCFHVLCRAGLRRGPQRITKTGRGRPLSCSTVHSRGTLSREPCGTATVTGPAAQCPCKWPHLCGANA